MMNETYIINETYGIEDEDAGYLLAFGMAFCYCLYGLTMLLGIPLNFLVLYRMIKLSTRLKDFYR